MCACGDLGSMSGAILSHPPPYLLTRQSQTSAHFAHARNPVSGTLGFEWVAMPIWLWWDWELYTHGYHTCVSVCHLSCSPAPSLHSASPWLPVLPSPLDSLPVVTLLHCIHTNMSIRIPYFDLFYISEIIMYIHISRQYAFIHFPIFPWDSFILIHIHLVIL